VAQLATARMATDRLMEMLQEQEEWEGEAAAAAAAAAPPNTPAKPENPTGAVGDEEGGYGGAGGEGGGGLAGDEVVERGGDEGGDNYATPRKKPAASSSVPGTPGTPAQVGRGGAAEDEFGRPVDKAPVSRAGAASQRLAADILAGSDLGRAYHPLLASIEARLLHLRSETLDVSIPGLPA
jgi:hypothetical protein